MIRAYGFTLLAALCTLAATSSRAAAQQVPTRSTREGVYTAEQAAKGQEVFGGRCQSCHSPTTHTGPNFLMNWAEGRPLWGIFSFVKDEMPYDAPGSLTPEQYAQVMAYLLKQNGLPAGTVELPSAPEALQAIKFEAPPVEVPRR